MRQINVLISWVFCSKIPGTIMMTLGLLFWYSESTYNWEYWAFMWSLIPAGTGLGIWLAAKIGGWKHGAAQVGIVISGFSLAIFLIFSTTTVKTVGAVILILIGLSLLKKQREAADELPTESD